MVFTHQKDNLNILNHLIFFKGIIKFGNRIGKLKFSFLIQKLNLAKNAGIFNNNVLKSALIKPIYTS